MRALAYVAGVYEGDGYLTNGGHSLGLHVADREFAEAFAIAVEVAFGVKPHVRREGKYWRVAVYRKNLFLSLPSFEPLSPEDCASWVRGFFDSEGNVSVFVRRDGYVSRRVSMYNTDLDLIERTVLYLSKIDIKARWLPTKPSKSHLGTKTVFELKVVGGKSELIKFAATVGSSIPRKQELLDSLKDSYSTFRRRCKTIRHRCKYGHPLVDGNTYLQKNTVRCLTCRRTQLKEWRARVKLSQTALPLDRT
jgi:hypothetical protein